MVSHHPAKFGGYRHCGNGDMMVLVVEGQDSTCPHFNQPLLFMSIVHGLKSQAYHINNSDPGYTRLKQQFEKI